jgi:hypothetical protein
MPIGVGVFLAVPLLWLFMATHLQALWMVKNVFFAKESRSVNMTKVINPLATSNFLLQINLQLKFSEALDNDNKQMIAYYASLLEKEIKVRPDKTKLTFLEEAYQALEKPKELERVSSLKHHLFPGTRTNETSY